MCGPVCSYCPQLFRFIIVHNGAIQIFFTPKMTYYFRRGMGGVGSDPGSRFLLASAVVVQWLTVMPDCLDKPDAGGFFSKAC